MASRHVPETTQTSMSDLRQSPLPSHVTPGTSQTARGRKPRQKQSVGCNAKDIREISEKRPNEAKSSLTDSKTAKADPRRPGKVSTLEAEVSDQGRDQDEAEEEEEEEEMEFPCPSCAEVFSLQWQLRDHVELHQSSVKRTQCSVCTHGMDTCKLPGSKRHRPYHCVPCQQSFSAMGSFLEHCQEHLRARVEEDCLMEGYAQQTLNVATV
ncbi:zinc finger protein 135-like [Solea senegalensis]|uniref:Zinc finger protein 135-like n=1 Tax=Solea senegalensis TaxID=28829 RepID=A0AAV6PKN5_SOLSE|nr:zinc finger protein 135-like [Solea senegalensis]